MDGNPAAGTKRRPGVVHSPPRPTPPDARELAALRYLIDHIEDHGYPPSIRELGQHLYVSADTAGRVLRSLGHKGYIRAAPGRHRAFSIRPPALALVEPQEATG